MSFVKPLLMQLFDSLLARNGLSGAFASSGVGACALPVNRQTLFVPDTSVTTDIPKTSNILSNLSAELAAYLVVAVDYLRYPAEIILGERPRLGIPVNLCFHANLLGCVPAYPVNVCQGNPYRLFVRNINTNYTRHIDSYSYFYDKLLPTNQPWRCLCRGFEQITRTTPLRRTTLQFSQIRFTELLTFIFSTLFLSRRLQRSTNFSG
jgi:hypothetical protein